MTSTHASALNLRVGRSGRAVHAAGTDLAGNRAAITLCGSEGRTPGASRLYDTDDAVTCRTCLRALDVIARRVAEVEAIADAAEPAEVEEEVVLAGQAAPLAEHAAPRQDLDGEFRYDEQGNARYWTAEEVAAERAASEQAPAPAAEYAYRFTRTGTAGEYAVGYLPTLDSIDAGLATSADGRHLGRVRRLSQEWQSLSPKWQGTAPDGTVVGSHYRTRDDAARALRQHVTLATVDADTITNRRELLAAVEVQTRHLGYTSAAAYLQAPGRERTRARAEVAASDPDGPDLPEFGDGRTHLLSDDLLDACGTAGPGGLSLAPSTTPERIDCPACRPLVQAEQIADAILDRRPALLVFRPEVAPADAERELSAHPLTTDERAALSAGVRIANRRLREEHAEQPAPLEWSEVAAPAVCGRTLGHEDEGGERPCLRAPEHGYPHDARGHMRGR